MDRFTRLSLHDLLGWVTELLTRWEGSAMAANDEVETVMNSDVDCDQVRCESRAISMNKSCLRRRIPRFNKKNLLNSRDFQMLLFITKISRI